LDPDPAFYLNEYPHLDPDPVAKPIRIHADPDPGQTFKSQKVEFLHEKYTGQKTYLQKYKCLFESQETRLFVNFGKFPYWILDLDPQH
jgi:hypothetical protein